jgi:hypothetical protein
VIYVPTPEILPIHRAGELPLNVPAQLLAGIAEQSFQFPTAGPRLQLLFELPPDTFHQLKSRIGAISDPVLFGVAEL